MAGLQSEDLSTVLTRVALRDRHAFAELYDRTGAKLFGVCLRILNSRSDAEEALQEVYVKVWQSASRFDDQRASPITWLVAVARNHAIDILRSRRPAPVDLDEAYDVSDPEPGPEALAIAAGEGRRIDLCLDELEAAKATAVRSAYVDGDSYQELSERLGVPLNTIRTWLRRSLMRLRECLER